MPQEVIYYLGIAFVTWLVLFAVEYRTSESMTLADLLIDGLMALCFPITICIIIMCLIADSSKIYIKKPKKK